MDELVTRIRRLPDAYIYHEEANKLLREAADEIDRLREVARFALRVTSLEGYGEDDPDMWRDLDILGDMARKCLADSAGDKP